MEDPNNILLALKEISKPASILIEKISEATGGLFRPYQIKRVAGAEAEADEIKAVSQIKIRQLQLRALHRFLNEEAKKQANMEIITKLALPQLNKDSNPKIVNDDWITNFFDKTRIVSDKDMQKLWAKILAGEANNPGSFSKRTVNTMASLDKEDAEMFNNLCNFIWFITGTIQPIVFDPSQEIYIKNGVNFGGLTHLESIGLISFNTLTGYINQGIPQKILVGYHGTALILEFQNDKDNSLDIGKILLSSVGKQLSQICSSKKIVGLEEYVIKEWINKGIRISSPYNHPPIKA